LTPLDVPVNISLEKLLTLRRLSEQPFDRQEREILQRLHDEGSEAVQRFILDFGFHRIITAVHRWHARFRKSLSPDPPRERVLCAFTSVADRLVDQDELKALVRWAAQELDLLPEALLEQAGQRADSGVNSRGGDLTVEVFDLTDLIAALIYFFESPPGLKPVVRERTLRDQLDDFLTSRSTGRVRRVLGGAAAVAADVLAELEAGDATLYTVYHSAAQAMDHQQSVQRLSLGDAEAALSFTSAQTPGVYQVAGKDYEHPTSASTIFSYDAGFALDPFRAFLTDRVIFRHAPRGPEPPLWREIWVHPGVGPRQKITERMLPLAADEWPWLPGFLRWWVEGKALHLVFAGEDLLRRIAERHHYIVLSGIGPGTFDVSDALNPLHHLIAKEVAAQLRILADAGATLHLEISGSVGRHQRLTPLAEVLDGVVHSLGLNDAELAQMTDMADFQVVPKSGYSQMYERYHQALALAERLSLSRLYVHGNDADLILRRRGSPGAMRDEVTADLFAKGVVVLSVLQRSGLPWQERARHLSPVLLWRGFEALISLASDLAAERHPDRGEAYRRQLGTMLDAGYALVPRSGGYAVAVVPVMWPALPRSIHPSGAGDICSSVSLVYAGF
jgi:hypothetical protein